MMPVLVLKHSRIIHRSEIRASERRVLLLTEPPPTSKWKEKTILEIGKIIEIMNISEPQ